MTSGDRQEDAGPADRAPERRRRQGPLHGSAGRPVRRAPRVPAGRRARARKAALVCPLARSSSARAAAVSPCARRRSPSKRCAPRIPAPPSMPRTIQTAGDRSSASLNETRRPRRLRDRDRARAAGRRDRYRRAQPEGPAQRRDAGPRHRRRAPARGHRATRSSRETASGSPTCPPARPWHRQSRAARAAPRPAARRRPCSDIRGNVDTRIRKVRRASTTPSCSPRPA